MEWTPQPSTYMASFITLLQECFGHTECLIPKLQAKLPKPGYGRREIGTGRRCSSYVGLYFRKSGVNPPAKYPFCFFQDLAGCLICRNAPESYVFIHIVYT